MKEWNQMLAKDSRINGDMEKGPNTKHVKQPQGTYGQKQDDEEMSDAEEAESSEEENIAYGCARDEEEREEEERGLNCD